MWTGTGAGDYARGRQGSVQPPSLIRRQTPARLTTEATFAKACVHGQWQLAGNAAVLYGTLAWRRVDGDRVAVAQQRVAVSGAPLSDNAAVIQAGFDFGLSPNSRLRAGYDGVLASCRDRAADVSFQMTF